MELQDLLGHFEDVQEDHDGYLMRCPAHENENSKASLKLMVGEDGKARITCRAFCKNDDVVKAAGLRWADFFNVTGLGHTVPADKPKVVTGAPVAALAMYVDLTADAYAYSDADYYAEERFGISKELGAALELGYDDGEGFKYTSQTYTRFPRLVVPFKDFHGNPHNVQGRDLTGDCPQRWVNLTNPGGFRWGQYGVFRGSTPTDTVIISEGPGDALTAVGAGYDSIAIRGAALAGSEALLDELAEGLREYQRVVVAGDNDAGGQKFNAALADGLRRHSIDVHALAIPDLGPKSDLTDWRKDSPESFSASLAHAVEYAKRIDPPKKEVTEVTGVIVSDTDKRIGVDVVSSDQGKEARRLITELAERYGRTDKGAGTDVTNAYALVAWADGSIKYATGLGFYVWNGAVWEHSTVKVRQRVHAMGAALILADARSESAGFTSNTRIEALLAELRSVPSVHADPDDFDANPDLLSFRNGTVDLRNGSIRPHEKTDMITVMVDVNYIPNAEAPRFEGFLGEIMPGMPDMPAYLQRLIGYGLTGHTSEQCFAVLFGKGSNGKSILCDTIADIFGAVTKDTPFATFEERASGGIPNDIAALRDARLVTASEGDSGKPMSEGLIKKVTGDKNMTARFMRSEFFTFTPRFLVLMATNHKPQFRGQDDGLWRRVKLIPFRRYFAYEERDFGLDKKLLAEAEGIAAWAVRGAIEWYKSGLRDPSEIIEATADYQATSNPLDGFVPGMYEITKDTGDSVKGADLYLDYRDWAEAEGLQLKDIWKRPTLYRSAEDLGAQKKKTEVGIKLFGIKKAELPEEHPDTPDLFKA